MTTDPREDGSAVRQDVRRPDVQAWLAQIKAEADAATEGPWIDEYSGREGHCVVPHDAESTAEAVCVTRLYRATADAAFIASSRATVPALVAALEAVLALHDEKGLCCGFCGDPKCCPPPCRTSAAIAAHIPTKEA